MKNFTKYLSKMFLLALLFAVPTFVNAGEAEREVAKELLDVINFEQFFETAKETSIQFVLEKIPNLKDDEAALRAYYQENLNFEDVQNLIISVYSEMFTVEDLKGFVEFYQTEAGQHALEKCPEVMAKTLEYLEDRILENAGDIQKMIQQDDEIEEIIFEQQ